ncbi:hypothetical protein LEP1GSC073_3239 [Leptospira noguchii str. Cascata]|nr:hypothetical protein LEP1GSC073_3239 [Leptospira noguchii str. Cascata]
MNFPEYRPDFFHPNSLYFRLHEEGGCLPLEKERVMSLCQSLVNRFGIGIGIERE